MGRVLIAVACVLVAFSSLQAQEWVTNDARAKAMGNAGVATTEGPMASYWNPGNLCLDSKDVIDLGKSGVGFAPYIGVDVSAQGELLTKVDQLSDLFRETDFFSIQNRLNGGTASVADIQNMLKIVKNISDLSGKTGGVAGNGGGGIELKLGNLGIFYRQIFYAGIDAKFDLSFQGLSALSTGGFTKVFQTIGTTNAPTTAEGASLSTRLQGVGLTLAQANELAYQAEKALGAGVISQTQVNDALTAVAQATVQNTGGSTGATLYNNTSGVIIKGIRLEEYGLAYGIPLAEGKLGIGLAAKYVRGETSWATVFLKDVEDGSKVADDLRSKLDENRKATQKFNADLGVRFSPNEWLRLGIVGKNVLPMDFKIKNSNDKISIDPNYRAGVSVAPLSWVKFGLDFDITETKSEVLTGYKSREIGAGVEFTPHLGDVIGLNIRAGGYKNTAESGSGLVYTGGIGIKIWRLNIDFAGQMSTHDIEIESVSTTSSSKDIRERYGASALLSLDFKF